METIAKQVENVPDHPIHSSILVCSNRKHNLKGLLNNIQAKTENFGDIEVWIKLDEESPALDDYSFFKFFDYKIYIITAKRLSGKSSLGIFWNQMINLSNGYFNLIISDKVRFAKNWDSHIKEYAGNVHILKCTPFSENTIYIDDKGDINRIVCIENPDSRTFYSKKFIQDCGGIPSDLCEAPDSFFEVVLQRLRYDYNIDIINYIHLKGTLPDDGDIFENSIFENDAWLEKYEESIKRPSFHFMTEDKIWYDRVDKCCEGFIKKNIL